jgi:hypothetical protein
VRRLAAGLALVAWAAGCAGEAERSPEAYCRVLGDLAAGRVEVGSAERNELVGHVRSLEALMAVAPPEVEDDLGTVRDALAGLRDAGGLGALRTFDAIRDPQLAEVEARVTRFTAEACGVAHGELDYEVGEIVEGQQRCPGWTMAGSPLTNNRFPYWIDVSGANYFGTLFWSIPFLPAPARFLRVERGGWVEFEGEYPYARYFAFHPNDVALDNLDTIHDSEIDPEPGSVNPWRGPPGEGDGRRYRARLVFGPEPEVPEPNTSYMGERQGGGFNPIVFLLYRIYAADQGSLPPNSAGVKLPAITVYDAEGNETLRHEACDPYPPGFEPPVDRTRFPAFPVPDHRAVSGAAELNTASNFGLPTDLLANGDVQYLTLPYAWRHGEVFVVRARKPRTPSARLGIPLWDERAQLRMWSVCSYNFWSGVANDCRLDEAVPAGEDGFYTLVVSRPEHRPANARAELGSAWLDAGPYGDGWVSFRILMRDDPFVRELAAAVEGEAARPELAPFVPRGFFCSRETFERGGWRACAEAQPAESGSSTKTGISRWAAARAW